LESIRAEGKGFITSYHKGTPGNLVKKKWKNGTEREPGMQEREGSE